MSRVKANIEIQAEGYILPAGTVYVVEKHYPATDRMEAMVDLLHPETDTLCWAFEHDVTWVEERINEAEVIRLTERREALLERRSYALDRLAHCSGEAEAMWLEMIEDATDALEQMDSEETAKLDNPASLL